MTEGFFRDVLPGLGTKKAGPPGAGVVQFVYRGQAEAAYSARTPV